MNKKLFYLSLPILVLALGLVISGIPRVQAGPGNFTIQATGPIVFPAGQGASSSVKVNSTAGFSGTINVGVTSSPAGLSVNCAPPSVSITPASNGTTSCNLSSTTPGNYVVTISGSNGTAGGPGVVTHSVNVAVTVISFTSSLSPSGVTFNSGSSGKAVLTMVPSVFNETVNLSSSSVPATGLTVGFSLSSLVLNTRSHFTANSTVTFSSSSPNVYNVTITGTSTTAGHPPVSFNAIVNVQGYSLSPSPGSFFREKWGDTFTSTVTLTALTGFTGTVSLAAQPLTGFGFAFSPPSVTLAAGGTSSSVLTVTLGTPSPGNVTAIVTGTATVTGGKLVNSANIQVQIVGLICIADPSGFTTNCPSTPYIFSGPPIVAPQKAATQIRIGVFAQGSGFMNGADITLLTNNNILKPYAIDLSGSILPGANVIVECLNGVLVVGTTCAASDVVGTIHASIGAGSGLRTNDNATGLIFTAVYNITGTTPVAGIAIGFQTGCAATSVAGQVTCVTINNGATKPVPEDVESASFNNAHIPSSSCATTGCLGDPASNPYIAVTSSAPVITVPKNGAGSATITATAENLWPVASTDSITFTAVATAGFAGPSFTPSACGTGGTSCSVIASFNTGTPGTYFTTIFGTYIATDINGTLAGTGLTSTLIAPVTVQVNVQDVGWTINGVATGVTGQVAQTFQIPKGGPSSAFVYAVQSLGGYTGTVTFGSQLGGTGLTFAFGSSFTLQPGATVTRLVNVTTTTAVEGSSVLWEPNLAATGLAAKTGSLDHVNVNGFSISPASTTVSFATGGSATDVITLTSLGGAANGFTDNVTVTGSSTPTTGLIITCNYPIVPKAGSATSNCRFISATPGTYSVIITGAGGSNGAIRNSTGAISVTVSGDFTIGANPTSVTISTIGGRGDSTITVTSQSSLAGTVNLSSSATLASGLACSLNPTSIVLGTSGTSTLSCVSSNTGKFNVTVTGAFTGSDGLTLTHALNVTYTISVSQTTTTVVSCLPNSVTVGVSTSCTSTVTGASTAPSGTVSFSNGVASGGFSPLSCNLGTPSGNSASCSVNYTPMAVGSGSHSITATYQGDTTHSGSVSTAFALTVTKASPTITTTPSATSVNTGQTASDSASFGTGTAFQPSGTVTYRLFPTVASGVCSGTPGIVSIVTISNTGTIPNSRAVTFNLTGTFGFEANYPGDANNNAATGSCEPIMVSSAIHTTTTTVTCTPGSVAVGTSTSCLATVTDTNASPTNPGGTVTIAASGSGTLTPSNGQCTLSASGTNAATCSVSYTPNAVGTGSQSISDSYGGDANHSTSQSTTPFALTITKASPAVTTTPSAGSITVGGTASDSASFTTGTAFQPTGSVTYLVFPTVTAGVCSGASSTASIVTITGGTIPASRLVIFNSTGTFGFRASYPGDANNNAATGPCEPVTVAKASPAITTTTSSTSITVGGASSDSASFTSGTAFQPTGTVTYVLFPTVTSGVCSGVASSVSIVTITTGTIPNSRSVIFNSTGTFGFEASYPGDSNNNAATSVCEPLVVGKASPTITTTPSSTSITIGGTVSDSASFTTGTAFQPTGSVSYLLFPTVTSGVCSGASNAVSIVTIASGTIPTSRSVLFNSTGTFGFVATYPGDANNNAATSGCEPVTVSPPTAHPTTTVVTCATQVVVGGTSVCSANVSDASTSGATTPSGSVSFTTNSTGTFTPVASCNLSPTGPASASCTVTYNPTVVGHANVTGTYVPGADTTHSASKGSSLINVTKTIATITTTTSQTSITVGGAVSDSASFGAGTAFNPTGSVRYLLFSTVTSGTCSGPAATVSIVIITGTGAIPNSRSVTFNSTGTFGFEASYSGDSNNLGVNSACEPVTVLPPTVHSTSTAVVCTSVKVGSTSTCTATVTDISVTGANVPSGSVSFTTNSTGSFTTTSCTLSPSGAASASCAAVYRPTIMGHHNITATYAPGADTTHSASSGITIITVAKASPAITTIPSQSSITVGGTASDSATFTAGSAFQPTGTVTYVLFSTVASGTCSGTPSTVSVVTITVNGAIPSSRSVLFNSTGTFGFEATYPGDSNNNAANSACEPVTVSLPTANATTTVVTCTPGSVVVGTSTSCMATVTDASATPSSPTGTVTFTAGGSGNFTPSNAQCTLSMTGTNTATCSVSYAPSAVGSGTQNVSASYGGDTTHKSSVSATPFSLTITKASPVITTVPSASSITIGGMASDLASFTSGTAFQPTGSVIYLLFPTVTSGSCSGIASTVSVVTIATGTIPSSRSVTFNATGTFGFEATYGGDPNNNAANSSCEPITVSQVTPHATITLVVCSPSSVQVSAVTTCTATVADTSTNPTTPTGTVGFTTNSTGTFTPTATCSLAGTKVGTANCSVSYTPTVTGHHLVTGSYLGDSTHSASTGSFNVAVTSIAPPPLHSTKTVVTCSPGSVLANTSTSCTARVIDNSTSPTVPTGTVTFTSNSTGAFNPSAICSLVAGNAPNMASCSVSYTPTATGKHMITGSYGGDSFHAQSSASFTVNVRSLPGGSILLTFNGFELDDFNNGVGQLDVLVNGQLVVDLPAGLNGLSGTGDYKLYENVAVDFGPFDITTLVVNGQNTILFRDPTSFDHFGVVRNVAIIQDGTTLLQVPRARGVYPGFSFSYTFSNPPLVLTGVTASRSSLVLEQPVTFTANYTGGTGPVNCIFLFGDGGSATVPGINGTCTAIHHYFGSGSFIVRVIIIGSSTSDRVRGNLSVTVANDSTEI